MWENTGMTDEEKLAKYRAKLAIWEAAEEVVATTGQSYDLDDGDMRRSLTFAHISQIRKSITFYSNKIATLERKIANLGKQRTIVFGRGR